MHIIPAINCQTFDEAQKRFALAGDILLFRGGDDTNAWVHLDIADGSFTDGYQTWRSAGEFMSMQKNPNMKVELHVMVENPEAVITEWLSTGVDRIIFHIESTKEPEWIINLCKKAGVQAMIALRPETPVEEVKPYLEHVSGCQLLAVIPGLSGQKMQQEVVAKIKELRTASQQLIIEVDGGITPQTARLCKEAGANQLISSSYVFSDESPAAAYGRLQEA